MVPRAAYTILAFVLVSISAPRASAVQSTVRVSVDSNGTEANGASLYPIVSSDGNLVLFASDSSNLVAGDTNKVVDVFLHDRSTGVTELVSVGTGGNLGDANSLSFWGRGISDDGRFVVFRSDATNFDPNDANGCTDVFVRDRVNGTTTRVSVDSAGNEGNWISDWPAISADGGFVCFTSFASNLVANDQNNDGDIFVHETATGITERVSVDSAGVEGNTISAFPAISADGRFVAFGSLSSNLVPGDTNRKEDTFVRDRQSGTTERVSIDSSGKQSSSYSGIPSISADGRLVAFEGGDSNLVAGDNNHAVDVFVHDRASGTTIRASVDSSGAQGDGDSTYPQISADGSRVVFVSEATKLVAGDTNGVPDIFVHTLATGETERVSVDSSGGQANGECADGAISADGGTVAFLSPADDLVSSDTNTFADIFVHSTCVTAATWTNYGSGVPGTNGVPSLTASQLPAFGATVDVDLSNSYGAPTTGLLVLGLQGGDFKTKFGGHLLVVPTLIVPITFSYGFDTFTGTIPVDLDLCGVTVDLQGIEFDPGAPLGVSFSQGLELVIGN